MEKKQNLGTHPSKFSTDGQFRKKNQLLNGSVKESSKKGNSTIPKPTGGKECVRPDVKTEELNGKKRLESSDSDGGSYRRPNTIPGGPRRKEKPAETVNVQTSKSSYERKKSERKLVERGRSTSPMCTGDAERPPNRSKSKRRESSSRSPNRKSTENRVPLSQYLETTSLLPQAIQEQQGIIIMLRSAMEEIRQKIVEKTKSKLTIRANSRDSFKASEHCLVESCENFQNSYSGVLEEIFQAWMNLFYFIVNLNVNLIRVLNSTSAEPFCPCYRIEQDIVGQAIECLKFYSKLKMKTVMNSLEALHVPEGQTATENQIQEFERQASSSFLLGMDFMQEKAKEILEQSKK